MLDAHARRAPLEEGLPRPAPDCLLLYPNYEVMSRLLITEPELSSLTCLAHTIGVWGTGSDDVGFIQSTKAPNKRGAVAGEAGRLAGRGALSMLDAHARRTPLEERFPTCPLLCRPRLGGYEPESSSLPV